MKNYVTDGSQHPAIKMVKYFRLKPKKDLSFKVLLSAEIDHAGIDVRSMRIFVEFEDDDSEDSLKIEMDHTFPTEMLPKFQIDSKFLFNSTTIAGIAMALEISCAAAITELSNPNVEIYGDTTDITIMLIVGEFRTQATITKEKLGKFLENDDCD